MNEHKLCDSILTSGLCKTAKEGVDTLKHMVEKCHPNGIGIIVAGKVTPANLELLREKTTATAFHGRRIVGDLSGN